MSLNIEEAIDKICSLENEANLLKRNRDDIIAMIRKAEQASSELREKVISEMKTDGVVKDGLTKYDISLRNTPATIEVVDIDSVPEEFTRIKREPDKIKIKDAAMRGLKANWFSIIDGKETLTIKGKST
jgi:hypothetical protein